MLFTLPSLASLIGGPHVRKKEGKVSRPNSYSYLRLLLHTSEPARKKKNLFARCTSHFSLLSSLTFTRPASAQSVEGKTLMDRHSAAPLATDRSRSPSRSAPERGETKKSPRRRSSFGRSKGQRRVKRPFQASATKGRGGGKKKKRHGRDRRLPHFLTR